MDPRAQERARAWGDAFARGDRDAFLALTHPEAELHLPRSVLEGGPGYHGLEGAAQAWADAFDLWERFEVEPRDLDAAGDVLIVVYRVRCVPHREGPPVEYISHSVFELRDGKIAYSRPYLDRAEARKDAEARAARALRSD